MRIDEQWNGTIGDTLAESEPHWPSRPHPGEDAPNVVIVLFDDLGFAHLGCYGSTLDTPRVDAIAGKGLRYTNFHTTPLCSPTRAALLTGRNHHSVGMRAVANFNTGFPHMTGEISPQAATMAEVLSDEGYATFCVGKWHLCQMADASAAGPFDNWPLQRGFDRFYGFLQGETDHFSPELTYDNHHIEPPRSAEEGYHFTEDMTDKAIEFIHDSKSIRPDRPVFLYYALGAVHAPHQAPAEYLERQRGRFDEGWDVARERWFARQLADGIIPKGTELAPRNPGVDAWDDMGENQRRLAVALQEAFAAFLEHTDTQIGRLVDALENLGELDNTLLIIASDNGASQEGGPFGVLHEMKFFNGILESPDEAVAHLDDIGGPHSHSNYPWGWAQAGNTPNKWYKQNTHGGGIRDPLIVHWPNGIAAAGEMRHQFHHVSDIAPTIYDVLDIETPSVYRGIDQLPVTGTSLRYSWDAADEPSHKKVQYFEMGGHRGIYADGWKAVTRHEQRAAFDEDVWELYHLAEDFSECHDLAKEMPDKLAEMVELWWSEARTHGVLPLDDRLIELFAARWGFGTPHHEYRYTYRPPMSHMPAEAAASVGGRSFTMEAQIERKAGQGGVLFATGTENSGISFFLDGDTLVFDYNAFDDHTVAESTSAVPGGQSTVGVRFERNRGTAIATLLIDGADVGSAEIPKTMRMMSSVGADVGMDRGSAVSRAYKSPNPFEGTLSRLDIEVQPTRTEREAL
ncbi:MAG: arylsulfatase, partial [Acidobacteria bacterium]|nr:arylsulfatase [Acidobacteriota bacterium]